MSSLSSPDVYYYTNDYWSLLQFSLYILYNIILAINHFMSHYLWVKYVCMHVYVNDVSFLILSTHTYYMFIYCINQLFTDFYKGLI